MCQLPQDVAITAVDAHNHPLVGELTAQKGEITSLALWLLAERSQAPKDTAAFVRALPVRTPLGACCLKRTPLRSVRQPAWPALNSPILDPFLP